MMLRLLIAVALPLIYILKSNAYGQNLSESSYLDRQLLFETANEELLTKKENLPIDRTNAILYAQEFQQGLNAFNQRNIPLAIKSFEQIKEASFLYVDAQKHLAVCYKIQTKYENAYKIWDKLSKKHISKAIDGLAMRAQSLERQHLYHQALNDYSIAIEQYQITLKELSNLRQQLDIYLKHEFFIGNNEALNQNLLYWLSDYTFENHTDSISLLRDIEDLQRIKQTHLTLNQQHLNLLAFKELLLFSKTKLNQVVSFYTKNIQPHISEVNQQTLRLNQNLNAVTDFNETFFFDNQLSGQIEPKFIENMMFQLSAKKLALSNNQLLTPRETGTLQHKIKQKVANWLWAKDHPREFHNLQNQNKKLTSVILELNTRSSQAVQSINLIHQNFKFREDKLEDLQSRISLQLKNVKQIVHLLESRVYNQIDQHLANQQKKIRYYLGMSALGAARIQEKILYEFETMNY